MDYIKTICIIIIILRTWNAAKKCNEIDTKHAADNVSNELTN